jgi:hypothetical protein
MSGGRNTAYFPKKMTEVYCPCAVQDGIGAYNCGIIRGRPCDGKLREKSGNVYKCGTIGLEVELR